jgi:hypothetical protein
MVSIRYLDIDQKKRTEINTHGYDSGFGNVESNQLSPSCSVIVFLVPCKIKAVRHSSTVHGPPMVNTKTQVTA